MRVVDSDGDRFEEMIIIEKRKKKLKLVFLENE